MHSYISLYFTHSIAYICCNYVKIICRLILMIIYSSILPVKSINSTALTVKVRHSNDVHQVCDSKCETHPTKVFI